MPRPFRRFALLVIAVTIVAGSTIGTARSDSASPRPIQHPELRTALHVPWAVGGPRIERDGTRIDHPGEWPQQPVRAIRLWDTRTAWLHLEPAQDRWHFEHLDSHLAKARANGVDHITLVLWGTPRWAARDLHEGDAPWLGPGSASPPRDFEDWLDYVTTVTTRYRGAIDAYQIGNEPNHPMFWRGSDSELIQMVVAAAERIRVTDPYATIIGPPMLLTDERNVRSLQLLSEAIDRATVAIDAWSIHWYPSPGLKPSALRRILDRMPRPVWLTEVGLPAQGLTLREQRSLIRQTAGIAQRAGVEYLAWYAWTDLGPTGLMDLQNQVLLSSALGLDRV